MQWVYNASPEVLAKSQYPSILGVVLGLTGLMVFTVALRGYVRVAMVKAVGQDDWVILFSAICSVIYSGLCISQSRWGLGLDIAIRPKENLDKYSVINFAGRPFYMAGITGFKVALCLSYLRILNKSNKTYRKFVWVVLVTCVLGHLGGTLVLIFQCKPVHKSWLPKTPGSCLPNDTTFYALAANSIIFDCIILVLPIPLLYSLQINIRRKIALMAIFLLGIFTTICSIMRMVQIMTIAKTGNSTMLVLWGSIEMNVGISLTCIPTLAPLSTYFKEKTSYYTHGASRERTNGSANAMQALKSSRDRASAEGWHDRDNTSDTSSQKEILGTESNVTAQRTDTRTGTRGKSGGGGGGGGGGITTTITVDVKVEDAEGSQSGEFRRRAEKWT
ncbi:hypothetical protein VC83_02952 [Pseudogymnoascus destructans]|uniref:Rhodopsin domain-containing protein n=2 Tax=Pseudogymnoascus destructans TaxID=655981 RepID=L8G149_PSED2|nr:uncharacterized protein VC83_02952 [Pseudogymnoascus destructans]ELR05656.1 hypothetical protein GMDG_07499 [Pseudogymnoascus destructans 20631-21]OAF60013.1 hypothetical protein VC83_02952 [Pseudogymnoascus destructans]